MKTWEKLRRNKSLWQKYFIREAVIDAVRDFFKKRKFHEVSTPLLVPSLILESNLDHFETTLISSLGKKRRMFLTTSPEASLKKLLVSGVGNCFEITKSFRNCEDGNPNHNPEFTILEWYRVNADYKEIMKDCEKLFSYILLKLNIKNIKYKNKIINLSIPWTKLTVREAMEKYAGVSDSIYNNYKNYSSLIKIARKKGYKVSESNTWEEIFDQIFLNEVEPKLNESGNPVILYDYPKPLSALARIKKEDPRFVERFELYISGLEIGDCYSELTDYREQKKRFKEELTVLKTLGKKDSVYDKDYLRSLRMGMPECSGIAVGVDRLAMLFTNSKSINEVILFPNGEE